MLPTLRPPVAASARPPSELSPDSSELSLVRPGGARWPDLNPILDGPDRAEAVKKAESMLEAWLRQNVPAADPEEQPFWTGLARWMARDMVDQARPEWGRGRLDDARHAVSLWGHEEGSPAPMRGAQGDPEKAVGLFRMLEGFMGDVRFRTRLASFLQSHDGKAARAEDLFHAFGLGETPLDGWLENPGFPMVHAELEGNKVKLSQQRMHLYPTEDRGGELWSIPVKIRYQDGSGQREFKTILTGRETEVTLPAKGEVDWIYPNGGGKGYYRTDVAPPASELGKLGPTERLAALSNQGRLVRHGAAPVGTFLDQVEATRADEDPSRLEIVMGELRFLSPQVVSADRPAFDKLVVDQLGAAFERLGPEGRPDEPVHDAALRRTCTMLLAAAGHAGSREITRAWGERYLAGDASVTPAMAACSHDPAVAERLLASMGEDQSETLRGLLSNPAHVDLTIEFALANQNELASRYLALLNPEKACALMESRWEEIPGRGGMLAASGLSPMRSRIDRLVAERGPDELRALWDKIKQTDGQAVNMADLPAKLSDWLRARSEPALEWLIA